MKHPCDYCHGVTIDDIVGNCMACGAPRSVASWEKEGRFNPWAGGTPAIAMSAGTCVMDSNLADALPLQTWFYSNPIVNWRT